MSSNWPLLSDREKCSEAGQSEQLNCRWNDHVCQPLRADEPGGTTQRIGGNVVLPDRIELSTSPLPMECSTTELRQRPEGWQRISDQWPDVEPSGSRLAAAPGRVLSIAL